MHRITCFIIITRSRADIEALQCHTDNLYCCDGDHTENGSVLGEWYYPNGSKVLSVDEIQINNRDLNGGYFISRSQSVIRLFASRGTTESGHFCCELPDQYGVNQTMCIKLGKNHCGIVFIMTSTNHL